MQGYKDKGACYRGVGKQNAQICGWERGLWERAEDVVCKGTGH